LAWDVTVPDTYAESHIKNRSSGLAADQAAKQSYLARTSSVQLPWKQQARGTATELVQEIGRRITAITEDARETVFLFERLPMALQQGNAVAFQNTISTK